MLLGLRPLYVTAFLSFWMVGCTASSLGRRLGYFCNVVVTEARESCFEKWVVEAGGVGGHVLRAGLAEADQGGWVAKALLGPRVKIKFFAM